MDDRVSSRPIIGMLFGKVLEANGLLPEQWKCRKFEMVALPDDVVILRYEVQLTPELSRKLSAMFEALATGKEDRE